MEFDRHGLRRHIPRDNNSLWEQSLVVESVSEAWFDHWDETLGMVIEILTIRLCIHPSLMAYFIRQMCKQGIWTESTYKKDTYNCYTFVLTFLQALGYGELSIAAKNRYVSYQIVLMGSVSGLCNMKC